MSIRNYHNHNNNYIGNTFVIPFPLYLCQVVKKRKDGDVDENVLS